MKIHLGPCTHTLSHQGLHPALYHLDSASFPRLSERYNTHSVIMATAYEQLPEGDEIDDSEIDFSDLRAQYEVRVEEGLDTFVVLDGIPVVDEGSVEKLKRFITKKLNSVGRVRENGFHMPLTPEGDDRKSQG
jgi:hypothetical protein